MVAVCLAISRLTERTDGQCAINSAHVSYRRRAPVDYVVHRVKRKSRETFRTVVDPDSKTYQMTKRLLAGRALTGS